jgi:hypothetical protein
MEQARRPSLLSTAPMLLIGRRERKWRVGQTLLRRAGFPASICGVRSEAAFEAAATRQSKPFDSAAVRLTLKRSWTSLPRQGRTKP